MEEDKLSFVHEIGPILYDFTPSDSEEGFPGEHLRLEYINHVNPYWEFDQGLEFWESIWGEFLGMNRLVKVD